MLSLCRSFSSARLARPFAQTRLLSNVSLDNQLSSVLEKEQDVPKSPPAAPAGTTSSSSLANSYKPFHISRHITPHHLTYDARVVRPLQRKKRPTVGPGASESKYKDYFHQLNMNPLDHCLNSSLISYFVSEMGKIHPRSYTGLTRKNQRKVGKAIRRAKMMGLIPIFSKRPLQPTAGPIV